MIALLSGRWSPETQTGSSAVFVLRVECSLKGKFYPGSLVNLEYGPVMATPAQFSGGEYGIWFLLQNGHGGWRPVPAGDTHAPLALGLVCYPLAQDVQPPHL